MVWHSEQGYWDSMAVSCDIGRVPAYEEEILKITIVCPKIGGRRPTVSPKQCLNRMQSGNPCAYDCKELQKICSANNILLKDKFLKPYIYKKARAEVYSNYFKCKCGFYSQISLGREVCAACHYESLLATEKDSKQREKLKRKIAVRRQYQRAKTKRDEANNASRD